MHRGQQRVVRLFDCFALIFMSSPGVHRVRYHRAFPAKGQSPCTFFCRAQINGRASYERRWMSDPVLAASTVP